MSIKEEEIFEWLDVWQALINSGQFEVARSLFSDDVVAFGTVTGVMTGLADLERRQWRQVWHRIKDFKFDQETAAVFSDLNSNFATVCCLWHSLGRTKASWYERRGRVTLVLMKESGGLRCFHSHFSMEPGIPPLGDSSLS